jgi:hypothetical protein
MSFWKTVNAILTARGQKEMLYGEALTAFYDFREHDGVLGVFEA